MSTSTSSNSNALHAPHGSLSAVLLALALSACAAGPDYRRPQLPDVQPRNVNATQFSIAAYQANWWEQFNDPVLAGLENRALRGNLDLRVALARVEAARAAFSETRLDYAPHVTLDGAVTRSKEQQPGFTDQRVNINSYSGGFDAAWELDLFGHVRRQAQAAQATVGAEQANLDDVRVVVAAEVARNYFELRGVQQRAAVARDNLGNQREALRLTQVRYEAGRVTELDVDSAEARLKATEATLPLLQADEKRYGYRLAVLLGVAPGSLDAELAARTVPAWVTPLPVGDVSTLLRHRPDVRMAERKLAAATAQVGVATAELFPRVSFSGFIGFLSGGAAQFGESGSRAWSATPVVSWPALDLGSARAQLRGARAQADGALAAYQQTVLTALEDFENSCAAYGAQQGRLASIVEQAQASRRAERLAQIQYREGSIDFLVLLDAQRTLLEAEDELAQAQTDVNTGAVAVYKALGGVRGA